MLARRLSRLRYEVRAADGGRAALALLVKEPVDLVLLDVMMPDLDGFAVLERMKANPASRHIPVVMIAALDEMESVVRLEKTYLHDQDSAISPQLAEMIVAGGADDPLKTHRREVTVVFLDLRGFTTFAETSEPEEVMGVLREYHGEMGRLILEHEGTLERFTGDGMRSSSTIPSRYRPVPTLSVLTLRG